MQILNGDKCHWIAFFGRDDLCIPDKATNSDSSPTFMFLQGEGVGIGELCKQIFISGQGVAGNIKTQRLFFKG